MPLGSQQPRFLSAIEVAEVLSVTERVVLGLLRTGELRGIKIGGRGIWRVEATELEDYIQRQYAVTRRESQAESPSS
ncbi:helix-turn-helix domain-containing protein [Solicola sp. PLA-1-18]|uniref:helix-turn-helix domain-containing protein n=1 Tax=Solicola sp. PLA-1-18 TaxID=3380532 RepID=UPI003B792825